MSLNWNDDEDCTMPDLSGQEVFVMSEHDAEVWLTIHGGFEAPRQHHVTMSKKAAESIEILLVELAKQMLENES